MTRLQIDLNADLGEGCGDDEAMLALVTSCNIACGGHAGDEASMRSVLRAAKRQGVRAGAHPSYPDRDGFGRAPMDIAVDALTASAKQQLLTIARTSDAENVALTHMKPHGALYHAAAQDKALAQALVDATAAVLGEVEIIGPPTGELKLAAEAQGLTYLAEGFADRAYQADGTLVPRTLEGAVLEGDAARTRQALQLATGEAVPTRDGDTITIRAQTLCLHGDTPGAVRSAQAIRAALEAANIEIKAPPAG